MPPSHVSNIHFNIILPSTPHCLGLTDKSVRIPGSGNRFVRYLSFYGEELLVPRPTPKLEDHPLSSVRDCLFNIFADTLHIWTSFLHPQPEDSRCLGDWTHASCVGVRKSNLISCCYKARASECDHSWNIGCKHGIHSTYVTL
jgi:hypothetical protein